jgi:hypothetical protein
VLYERAGDVACTLVDPVVEIVTDERRSAGNSPALERRRRRVG